MPAVPLDPAIVEELALDDHLHRIYQSGDDTLLLYIGYYHTSEKIGASHDPLVCFPGQGWHLTQKESNALTIEQDAELKVTYASMVAQSGNRRELIVYWFQALDTTSPNTFLQKVKLLKATLLHQGGDNAFVRISLPLKNGSARETKMLAADFIRAFYPQFLAYIMKNQ
jgi:EpsI family protein